MSDADDLPFDGPRGSQPRTRLTSSCSIPRGTPLQDQLDEITQRTRTLVQPERLAPSERAIAELFATGIEEKILPVGAKAPEFSLPNAAGRMVRSADLLALGPLVINFFRGRWCSYCVNELEAWQDLYAWVRERRALLVGISPQTVRQNDFAVRPHLHGAGLSSEVLSQHPDQDPFYEWRAELAAARPGYLCDRAGSHHSVCARICRLSSSA
jgi:hypothetical protein